MGKKEKEKKMVWQKPDYSKLKFSQTFGQFVQQANEGSYGTVITS